MTDGASSTGGRTIEAEDAAGSGGVVSTDEESVGEVLVCVGDVVVGESRDGTEIGKLGVFQTRGSWLAGRVEDGDRDEDGAGAGVDSGDETTD